jgi:iron complex transport system substrate-binding protein
MRPWRTALLGLALGLAAVQAVAAPPAASAAGPSLRDDRGITLKVAAPARRIVSMLPSLTETVCALGACDRLVGVDRYSNHPAEVRRLPQVGGLDDASVEAIVALKPDLVLLAQSARIIERLEALGLRVVVLEPRSQADVERVLAQVGLLVGSDQAGAAWRRIQAGFAEAERQLDPRARGLSVYYEVGGGPYAAGPDSFVGETMAQLGLRNIVPTGLGPYPKLNPEFVVRADPSLILSSRQQAAALAGRPGWQRIRALREGRVCRFDPGAGDVMARSGPRIGEAALLMVSCINRAVAEAATAVTQRTDMRVGSGP